MKALGAFEETTFLLQDGCSLALELLATPVANLPEICFELMLAQINLPAPVLQHGTMFGRQHSGPRGPDSFAVIQTHLCLLLFLGFHSSDICGLLRPLQKAPSSGEGGSHLAHFLTSSFRGLLLSIARVRRAGRWRNRKLLCCLLRRKTRFRRLRWFRFRPRRGKFAWQRKGWSLCGDLPVISLRPPSCKTLGLLCHASCIGAAVEIHEPCLPLAWLR
mmetsp:Transcript_70554/g.98083  ORF Transcript_70554/g.98083 Transcript_70554/m.98083 type:complete len:218 (-) Transcript_70554:352-1005(-)